uniref:Uncharacterized protein n=1 Tax=Arundo donax TaxID=35708 RepID=A0A0A9FTH4_ARUDO
MDSSLWHRDLNVMEEIASFCPWCHIIIHPFIAWCVHCSFASEIRHILLVIG